MEVALLNIRILIQKQTVVTDEIGNHRNVWADYHFCYASASGENSSSAGSEDQAAGVTADHAGIDFTVRICRRTAGITTDGYRVVFAGEPYDIIGIDHMNFKRKTIKLRCRKARRQP